MDQLTDCLTNSFTHTQFQNLQVKLRLTCCPSRLRGDVREYYSDDKASTNYANLEKVYFSYKFVICYEDLIILQLSFIACQCIINECKYFIDSLFLYSLN